MLSSHFISFHLISMYRGRSHFSLEASQFIDAEAVAHVWLCGARSGGCLAEPGCCPFPNFPRSYTSQSLRLHVCSLGLPKLAAQNSSNTHLHSFALTVSDCIMARENSEKWWKTRNFRCCCGCLQLERGSGWTWILMPFLETVSLLVCRPSVRCELLYIVPGTCSRGDYFGV